MRIRGVHLPVALAAGLAAAVAVGGTGASAAKQRAVVHPAAAVQSLSVGANNVSFGIGVTFAFPAGTPASSACKGTVSLSEKPPGAHAPKVWSAKLSAVGSACRATVHGTLPKALAGKTLTFHLRFGGNGKVAPFTKTKALKLVAPPAPPKVPLAPPPPPPTPTPPTPTTPTQTTPTSPQPVFTAYTAADGHWRGPLDGKYNTSSIDFTVVKGVIQPHFRTGSNFYLEHCTSDEAPPGEHLMFYIFAYHRTIGLNASGAFDGDYVSDNPPDPEGSGSGELMHVWFSGMLGANTGTI